LWHGASWNFVLWGALHGLYLLINHGWRQILGQRFSHKGWRPFFRLLTFLAVVAAWVPFRAPDLQTTKSVAAALFGLDGVGLPVSWSIRFHQLAATGLVHFDGALPNDLFGDFRGALRGLGVVLLVALFAPSTQRIVPMPGATDPIFRPLHWRPSPLWGGAVGVMLAVGVLLIGGESPFLYFRF